MSKEKTTSLLLTLFLIVLTYSISITRPWQFFDERLFYTEGLFPIPSSLEEMYEIISTYAFNYHIDSQNAFFSNIISIRSNVLGFILNILIAFLFKQNQIYYHILQIVLHTTNSLLAWFILYKLFTLNNINSRQSSIYSSLLTFVWAIHPANTEAVLLVTNWPSLLTYCFCFCIILFYVNKIAMPLQGLTLIEQIVVIFVFLTSISLNEYSYTLVPIVFFILLSFLVKKNNSLSKGMLTSLKLCTPLFIGLAVFLVYYFSQSSTVFKTQFDITLLFDRIFWLTPQIFFHLFKLFIFPFDLSLYQNNLINISYSYFDPKLILKVLFFIASCLIPVFIICIQKNKIHIASLSFLFYSFLFSLFPFLHIVSPSYCLIAERYCYFPLFMLIYFIVNLLLNYKSKFNFKKINVFSSVILIVITSILLIQTIIRETNWRDSFSLYSSSIKQNSTNIYKGQIYSILGYYLNITGQKKAAYSYFKKSLDCLSIAIKELETKKSSLSHEVKILKAYGIDINSLVTTCAFSIASTRFTYFKDSPKEILAFYEPYIKNNLSNTGVSQLDLYAKLLIKSEQPNAALKILNFTIEKYPFSSLTIYTLSNLLLQTHDLQNAELIITKGYNYYPTYKRMLVRMIKFFEVNKDYTNLAKYEYILGLRTHSKEAYQKSLQLYLELKKLQEANKVIKKLIFIDNDNPTTLLLLSKYYYLSNNNQEILNTLRKAYLASKRTTTPLPIYKSILLSLISFNLSYSNLEEAKKYIQDFQSLPNLQKNELATLENLIKSHYLKSSK